MVWGHSGLTLVLLLASLRMLHRAASRQRPQALFQGGLWWCALLLVGEVSSAALRGRHGRQVGAAPARAAAAVWLGLLCGLACAVNWRRCVRDYHGWQRRHAAFVLCTAPGPGFGTDDEKPRRGMVPALPGGARGPARPSDADP
mmetsp:Transcript_124479/g.387581  ORF Transcript_124479/g.387581 Transcript_124479/m.387581 type:complete len:144 (-) Transcript_124479:121-552(-)